MHTDFFPWLRKNETVSDTVKAWNIGNADALEGSKDEATTRAQACVAHFSLKHMLSKIHQRESEYADNWKGENNHICVVGSDLDALMTS